MSEEIQVDVLRRTQDTLGRFIKKPVLTEKLLKKPPFRFLHDICTAAMKETGFFEGVLSSADVKIENIKDKEGKILFLQKVIAAVESANNTKLSARPNKIVAGHEPANTNEFLQALAMALERQVKQKKNPVKVSKPSTQESSEAVKKKNEENKGKSKRKLSDPSNDEKGKKSVKKKENKKLSQKEVQDADPVVTNGHIDKSPIPEEVQNRRPQSARPNHRKASARRKSEGNEEQRIDNSDNVWGSKIEKNDPNKLNEMASEGQTVNEISTEKQSVEPVTFTNVSLQPKEDVSTGKAVAPPLLENNAAKTTVPTEVSSEHGMAETTAMRPRTALPRPPSARPAAPRVRERGHVSPPQEEPIKTAAATGKVNIIADTHGSKEQDEEDNEELVSVLQQPDDEDNFYERENSHQDTANTDEHGHLVAQILQVQRNLVEVENDKPHTEIEWGIGRNREITQREVDRVRTSVQTVTRVVYPLGKLLEFLPEDLDSMNQELILWQSKYRDLVQELDKERSLTEQFIEPLKIHLSELDLKINEQQELLRLTRANVLRNEEKILKHLLEF